MRETKNWIVRGFSDEMKKNIDTKLMDDKYSSWFNIKNIFWYRTRKIKGTSPKNTIETALKELQIDAKIWRHEEWKQISSYWVIEPKTSSK